MPSEGLKRSFILRGGKILQAPIEIADGKSLLFRFKTGTHRRRSRFAVVIPRQDFQTVLRAMMRVDRGRVLASLLVDVLREDGEHLLKSASFRNLLSGKGAQRGPKGPTDAVS